MENEDFNFSNSSSTFDSFLGTNPGFGFQASDILQSSDDGDEFTGIGDIGFGFQAPTVIGVSSSNDSQDFSSGDNGGGLLGGLLG